MSLPLALLQSIGTAVLGSPSLDSAAETLSHVARDTWAGWSNAGDEAARRAEIETLVRAPAEELRQAAAAVVAALAVEQPAEVRHALTVYLTRVPSAIRSALRRSAEPSGRTVRVRLQLHTADDLLPFLPVPLPRLPACATLEQREGTGGTGPAAVPHPPGPTGEKESSAGITLRVTAGPHEGRSFTFSGHDTFLVGRSDQAHFRLPFKDRYFSRIHFLVEVNPPHCRLMDMRSRNGTHVNGEKVTATDLRDGDEIRAGRTILRVSVHWPEELTVPAPTPPPAEFPPTLYEVPPPAELVPSAPEHPPACPAAYAAGSPKPVCPVCAALAARDGPIPSRAAAQGGAPSLCSSCRAESEKQAQPIPGYLIVRELGKGGMGIVYLAVRLAERAVVALKTIIPAVAAERRQVEKFLREARILQQLDHPHIVAFRDMGEATDRLFFAMDFVPGTDARHLLRSQGPLSIGRAVGLVCQLLEALEYAHARGFVHRDIKPANLLVTQEAGREVAKLADFGLARTYQASQLSGLTLSGDIGGTTPFMPPEQITQYREAKPPVDQYAAAATLYNLLTGEYVYDFQGNAHVNFLQILQEEPVPIRSRRKAIPEDLAAIIHRGLSRKPEERFPDIGAMRQALLRFAR